MLVGACKGELSLGNLTGSKPRSTSSSSSSSNDSDDSSSKSSGGGKVTPPPEVGTMESGKAPPWCKGYEKSSSDSNLSWVKSYMEREGWSGKTMEYVAKASCDKTDGERQAKVAEWAAAFKTEFSATDKDFVEMMTFQIMKQEDKSRLEDEQCAPFKEKDEEASLEQVVQTKAQAWLFGCENSVEEETLYYFDRPQIAEWMRAAILSRCIQGDPNKDKDSRGEFAFCMPDMKAIDRGKFEKELAGMKVNFYGKTNAILNFNVQKANAQILLKRYAKKGEKDEEWARLFEAPEKGWKEWMATYEANKAAFEAVKAFDKKAAKGSKKALADCGGDLRKLWFEHVKKSKGTLEYYQKCKYKTVSRSSTLEPVDVPADFGEGLKEGLMVDLMINGKKGRVAIPKGVYKDIDKKKFAGTFGVVW